MARYFSRPEAPRAYWDTYSEVFLPDLTVSEHRPVDTGLLDRRGDPIMRAPNPLGFGLDDEW